MLDEFADIKGGFELRFADGPFLVGLEVGRFTPDLILVDLGLPTIDPVRLARLLPTDARGRRRRCSASSLPRCPPRARPRGGLRPAAPEAGLSTGSGLP